MCFMQVPEQVPHGKGLDMIRDISFEEKVYDAVMESFDQRDKVEGTLRELVEDITRRVFDALDITERERRLSVITYGCVINSILEG